MQAARAVARCADRPSAHRHAADRAYRLHAMCVTAAGRRCAHLAGAVLVDNISGATFSGREQRSGYGAAILNRCSRG